MDITFEDVAHVIQDARYQQAILDTTPRPDKRVPQLPRGFNVQQFVEANDIRVAKVMDEPLGRWFLFHFADLPERINYANGTSFRNAREEGQFLKFVTAMHELRRTSPTSVEMLRLLRNFKLQRLSIVTNFMKTSTDSFTVQQLDTAIKHASSDEFAALNEQPQREDYSKTEIERGDYASPSQQLNDEVSGDDVQIEGSDSGDIVFNETHVSRYDTANKVTALTATGTGRPTGNRGRTTTQGNRMMMTMRNRREIHSSESINLNNAIQRLMEAIVQPIFVRLIEHRPAFLQYLRFKVFSLQPVSDRQIRYHRVLGQGAFGTVHGCIVAQTGTMLAMKIMLKKKIKIKHSKSQVVAERFALEALALHPSPYCMRLRYAFQTKDSFNLVLPLAMGGDLKFHLREGPFEEFRAKFYAAEIAIGLGHIHSLGFIMRDLKPRNILLDNRGHCKISDFGLAASIDQGRLVKGRAGTEGYWSPSVIDGIPYGIDADWWSYGCCLYELLTSFNPFSCKHTGLKTRNEGTRFAQVRFTKNVPPSAKFLIQSLLDRNIETRLGCGGNGVEEVISSRFSFWRDIDMAAIRRGDHPVPWMPEKGKIYAVSQSEMMENEDDMNGAAFRRVKLTPEDIPEFNDFVNIQEHQEDIVKILDLNSDVTNIMENLTKPQSSFNKGKRGSLADKLFDAASPQGSCCIIS